MPNADNIRRQFTSDELLQTLCWCQKRVLLVPAELMRKGYTLPCNTEKCMEMHKEESGLYNGKGI